MENDSFNVIPSYLSNVVKLSLYQVGAIKLPSKTSTASSSTNGTTNNNIHQRQSQDPSPLGQDVSATLEYILGSFEAGLEQIIQQVDTVAQNVYAVTSDPSPSTPSFSSSSSSSLGGYSTPSPTIGLLGISALPVNKRPKLFGSKLSVSLVG